MIFVVNLLFKVEIVKLIDIFYGLYFSCLAAAMNAASAAAAGNTLDFSGFKC